MTSEEAATLTVPFSNVPKRLQSHMEAHGVAIVTGVVAADKLHILEECMRRDLQALVAKAEPTATPTPSGGGGGGGCLNRLVPPPPISRRCEGLTLEGVQCKYTARSSRNAGPLLMGGDRCILHQKAKAERALDMGEDAEQRFELSDWNAEAIELLGCKERLHGRGLPQGSFAWTCRLLPSVRACFSALYPTDNDLLVVGLDMPFFAPTHCRRRGALHPPPHVDQNTKLYEGRCYQGILYISDATLEEASTTAVLPGSHGDLYRSLCEGPQRHKNHYIPLSGRALEEWAAGARRLPVPKGSLILWDSRLAHTGWRSGYRLAQPVCYEPLHRRSEKARQRKMECVLLGVSTTHSASEGRFHIAHGRPGSDLALLPTSPVNLKGRNFALRPWLPPLPLEHKSRAADAWYAREKTGVALMNAEGLIDQFILDVL